MMQPLKSAADQFLNPRRYSQFYGIEDIGKQGVVKNTAARKTANQMKLVRARIKKRIAEGASHRQISNELGKSASYVSSMIKRFKQQGGWND